VRINMSFDRDTLRLADREARRRKTSRSELMRSLVRAAASEGDAAAREQEMRERRHKAFEAIRKTAKEMGSWPAVKIVHNWRYRLMKDES